jgi:heme exporter protein CcmD
MKQYGLYILVCYGLAFLLLIINLVVSLVKHFRILKDLRKMQVSADSL